MSKPSTIKKRISVLGIIAAAALLLAAVPATEAADTSASSTNETPAIANIFTYSSDPSGGAGSTCPSANKATSFDPTAGGTTTVYVCVEATDANGYNDICDTGNLDATDVKTITVTDSADAALPSRSDIALTCATGSGDAVALTGSFTMEFWRAKGLAADSQAYKIATTITDVAGDSAVDPGKTFDYTALTAIEDTTSGALNFGSLAPGDTGTEQAATARNVGNTAFNVHVAGSALTGGSFGQTLAVGSLKWSTTATQAASGTTLTGSAADTSLAAAVEDGSGAVQKSVYFNIVMPGASSGWVPADTYTGTITLSTS